VNREEIYRRGDVDLCQSCGGWGELIYRAGSVAAVEKIRCVKGKLHVGNTRGDVIKLAVGQRYGIWHSPCLSKPTAQRYKTKKLTLHRILHNKRWGIFLKGSLCDLVSLYHRNYFQQTAHEC
jgi:hypothetical protein